MRQSPGRKCVFELLSIPHLVENGTYRMPFTGILRCTGTAIAILLQRVVGISEMGEKARVEVVVDAQDPLRYELGKARNGKLIQEEEIAGGKVNLSILVDPNDPWDLKLGKDADDRYIFVYDLNV